MKEFLAVPVHWQPLCISLSDKLLLGVSFIRSCPCLLLSIRLVLNSESYISLISGTMESFCAGLSHSLISPLHTLPPFSYSAGLPFAQAPCLCILMSCLPNNSLCVPLASVYICAVVGEKGAPGALHGAITRAHRALDPFREVHVCPPAPNNCQCIASCVVHCLAIYSMPFTCSSLNSPIHCREKAFGRSAGEKAPSRSPQTTPQTGPLTECTCVFSPSPSLGANTVPL